VRACVHIGECSYVYEYLRLYCVSKKKKEYVFNFFRKRYIFKILFKNIFFKISRLVALAGP
jgi:hypothetical protein